MSGLRSLLEDLRVRVHVDCDTLDSRVLRSLGPFVDCTSNQVIAVKELSKPEHDQLVSESIRKAKDLHCRRIHLDITLEELAVDIMIIGLQAANMPLVSGKVHVQMNPYYAYSTLGVMHHAERMINIFRMLYPELDYKRICFKVPGTWQGIKACGQLESQGITTLATVVFTMEQAALAVNAGCTYVAPYVNELKMSVVDGKADRHPDFELVRAVILYCRRVEVATRVIAASLTSSAEVLKMARMADHITIAPHILNELGAAHTSYSATKWASEAIWKLAQADYSATFDSEAQFSVRLTRSNGGENHRKLIDAINIFCYAQDELLAPCRKHPGVCGLSSG